MTTLATPPKNVMHALDHTGDTLHSWDPSRPDEVDAARRTFNDLKAKGYRAFRTKDDGSKGSVIDTFDPDARKLVLVPPIVGG